MDKTADIERLIAPALDAMGYAVVRVRLSGGRRPTLQVMMERLDGRGISLDDCAEVSRALSALLDVEDPIAGAYALEVSSPGIDRPLTRPADFERFAGREATVETRVPISGRRRFRGRLVGIDGDRVRIATAEGESEVPLGDIQRAKLALSETPVADAEKRRKTGAR